MKQRHLKPSLLKIDKSIIGLLLLAVLVLFLPGCTKKEEPQSLKIGVMSDLGAAPFIIAKEQGYFEKLGLELEITVFKSATDRDTAMQTGNLDGAMADMLTIVFYNDAALNAKMTSQTFGDYVMVTSPNTTLDALDKVSVGISSNTVIDFATEQIAREAGLSERTELVAIPQMPVRLEMLAAGELSAATLPEPLASAALLGGGQKVNSTLEMGLRPGVFIMTQTAIDEKADAIEKLYEGYNQGVDYLNTTDQAEYMGLLIEQLGFPPSLAESFDFPTLSPAQAADEVTFSTVLDWMKTRNLTTTSYEYKNVTTDAFVK